MNCLPVFILSIFTLILLAFIISQEEFLNYSTYSMKYAFVKVNTTQRRPAVQWMEFQMNYTNTKLRYNMSTPWVVARGKWWRWERRNYENDCVKGKESPFLLILVF